MKAVYAIGWLACLGCATAAAQVPTPNAVDTGTCVLPTYAGGDGQPHPCSYFTPKTTSSAGTANSATQAAMQSIVSQGENAISDAVSNWLRGDPAAKAAAEAAAEAEREREAELAREAAAAAERQRQAMFNRLSQELKMSGFADLSFKGFDSGPGLQFKGFGQDSANTANAGLAFKGFGDSASQGNPDASTPAAPGPQTCFFGEGCGPVDPGLDQPIDAWNDPKVVDLRDVQQGVDLAVVASKAPASDRQAIMDQALATTNGDASVSVTAPTDAAVPVVSEQGLLAFQQANNAYRQAHDSAYQLQQGYQQARQRELAADAIVAESEQQLNNPQALDAATLAEKQQQLAQIFDAALEQDLHYNRTWAEYLAARQKYFQQKYETEMYLWNTALGKQGNPPSPPPQLAASPGPPDADLGLVLPSGPVVTPTKDDAQFLQDMQAAGPSEALDPLTQRVLGDLLREQAQAEMSDRLNESAIASLEHQQQADRQLAAQPAQYFPPNLLNQYRNNPQFQQQMNAEHQTIADTQQHSVESAVQDADNEWQQKLSQLRSQGLIQPGVPLAQQAQNNPQLAARLAAARQQVTADLDYKVTRAEYQATQQWQAWIEQQEAKLPLVTPTAVAAVRG